MVNFIDGQSSLYIRRYFSDTINVLSGKHTYSCIGKHRKKVYCFVEPFFNNIRNNSANKYAELKTIECLNECFEKKNEIMRLNSTTFFLH